MENKGIVQDVSSRVSVLVEQAFSKSLASTIMAGFPVASIIAIFTGIKGLKLANAAGKLAAEHGLQAGAKNIVARALAINGIASGAYCTLIYLTFALIYVAYFAIYLLVILGILFIGFLTGM